MARRSGRSAGLFGNGRKLHECDSDATDFMQSGYLLEPLLRPFYVVA